MYSFKTKLIQSGKNIDGKMRYTIYLNREAITKLNAQAKMPVEITISPIKEEKKDEEVQT